MKLRSLIGVAVLVAASGAALAADVPANVAAAVADPGRPAADTALDGARKPAEILTFVRVKPGMRVVDVWPGAYWDRLFSKAVGPSGHVYLFLPLEAAKAEKTPVLPNGTAPFPGYSNVTEDAAPTNSFSTREPVDMVWIRQNYHDLYDKFMGPADVPGFDKAVFNALKPGGVFVIIDHSAPDGSGLADTDTTHRIDAARVKADMAATGFQFVGESNALRNPADTRDKLVFDPSIRGKTDQFVYLFRKP
ncbi:MAG TPA: methyltransferase [Caulobacteraceae bacterium]|nr:methyltransferase [Caulobacteraceae bacterium]